LNALVVFVLGIVAWAAGQWLDWPLLRLAAKPVPVLALACWTRDARERWLTAGLLLSAVGDLVMDLGRATPFFLGGMAAFALAHVAYIAAFVRRSRSPRWLALLPFAAWGVVLMQRLWPDLGPLAAPVAIYSALLLVMMWRALAASLASGRPDAALGAIVFGISGSLIALDRFDGPVHGARWLIMATYWTGQLLIARSGRPDA